MMLMQGTHMPAAEQAGSGDPKQAKEEENEKRTNANLNPGNARPSAAGGPLVPKHLRMR